MAETETVADLHATRQPVIDAEATPALVLSGAMVLQPSQARRRSGRTTPRASWPSRFVRTALEPIPVRLRGPGGEPPTPEATLELKVCDQRWARAGFWSKRAASSATRCSTRGAHDAAPTTAAGDDEVIVARRLTAQRCLYGVDPNPMAVDLAKVSLWPATLAKEHPPTFVDHALRTAARRSG